ncbi:uncharacterized protein [Periplaneta americana]|uniref:uncharacterized protein n=1 Tax=Periplaneta americana TaxID=6978 RepID=UPI0037E80FED
MRFSTSDLLFAVSLSVCAAIAVLPSSSSSLPAPRYHDHFRHLVRRDVSSTPPEYQDNNDDSEEAPVTSEDRQAREYRRNDKSFGFYDYLQPPYFGGYVPEMPYGYPGGEDANEILARTDPMDPMLRTKNPVGPAIPYPDSPIYYIRLPPTPYVFVPGLGYVSQPPPPSPLSSQINPFINLPIDFIANGKPTNIYQWSGAPAIEPGMNPAYPYPKPKPVQPKPSKPDSSVNNLNKGPYVFNGRPGDVYVLRDSVNALYSDALQNFYP